MAAGWVLHSLYASLLSSMMNPNPLPPTGNPPATAIPNVNQPPQSSPTRPIVSTMYGDVQGFQQISSSGVPIDTFLGIPFARPPVGNLRFSGPLPPMKWDGVRNASVFENECLQVRNPQFIYHVTDKLPNLSEDCLYLNVYKPVVNSASALPVMVWIHGGGFTVGGGSQYDGSELARKGVIVVTINYRLDIFGFGSNEDDILPGNYGMLDQIMALKWLQKNIGFFGGDPNTVTIFGESAGSVSVSMLILSPLAKGLFHRGIMESGVSVSTWAHTQKAAKIQPSQGIKLVRTMVGCDSGDPMHKLNCLRDVDGGKLLNVSQSVQKALNDKFIWAPVAETKFGFMPDNPVTLWSQGKFNHIDTIRGFNKAEYGSYIHQVYNYSVTAKEFVNFVKFSYSPFSVSNPDGFANDVFNRYVNHKTATNGHEMLLRMSDVSTDINFSGSTFIESNMESSFVPEKSHYIYQFDHRPGMSPNPAWLPPVHTDDLQFVFGVNLRQFQIKGKAPTTDDFAVCEVVQNMWTDFAKYGNPTKTSSNVIWDQYTQSHSNVLHINVISKQTIADKTNSDYIVSKLQEMISPPFPAKYVN